MKKIIVCSDDYKKKSLNNLYSNKLLNENFYINLDVLKEKLFFKIESDAILFTRDYLNVKYSVAATLLNNLYYIDNDYNHENLNILRDLKKQLIKNNLLTFDKLFPFYLKRHEVVVIGEILSKKDMLLVNEMKKYTKVTIEEEKYIMKKLDVYKYNTIEEEIDNVMKNIISLVNNNISLENIKICNVDSSYYHLLKRYSEFYNIKINFKKQDSILSSTVVNNFLELYKNNKNLNEIINLLQEKYKNNDILKKIINLINNQKNVETDLTDVFLYEFEKIKFDELRYDNAVELVDFYNYSFNDNYVFLMNFNNGTIPREFKDDDYFNDIVNENINLDTTSDKIILEVEKIKNKLFNIKNLFISYKEKTKSKEYLPSRLINILNMNVLEEVNSNEYSIKSNKIATTIQLEDFIKYDELNENLFKYYYLIEEHFNTYKNDYSKIDINLLKERLNNKINLSYTSLSTYFKCSFAFYLERILKIKLNNGNFYSELGSVFHEILENLNNENFDVLDEIEKNKELFKTNKELFFYNKLSKEFLYVLDIIKEQMSYTSLTEELYEEKVVIESKVLFDREFVGLVDKVIYKNINGIDYLAVIDYKTGNVNASLNNVRDGFNLQLPIYAYMLKKTNKFTNPVVLGMFLQQVLNKLPKYDSKSNLDESIKEQLKLKGFVIGENNLEYLDNDYHESKMISKLKMSKSNDKLDRFSKVLSEEHFDELANIVEKLINETFDNIETASFDINPKLINNINESCKYCIYESICYKKLQDNVYLEKNDFLNEGSDSDVD